ncbi:MAG: hypothetical protein KDA61_10320 [Planctomycetales bacterium]|nr:hypothetical protein [Planctomycetales bacterium]
MLLPTLIADTEVVVRSGLTLGSVLAVVCSWDRNRSIVMAIIAGILSWLYVIYFALTRE